MARNKRVGNFEKKYGLPLSEARAKNKQPTGEKLTQEQIKKFWEWCGFKFKPFAPQYEEPGEAHLYFIYAPDGGLDELDEDPNTHLPFIDLNNLFKYAVELKIKELKYRVEYSIDYSYADWGKEPLHCWSILKGSHQLLGQADGKDPALALFWAIWEVINKEEAHSG